jgi:hypothetical protein
MSTPCPQMAAAKAEILDGSICVHQCTCTVTEGIAEVICGLNEVLNGLPLIIQSEWIMNLSNEERHTIISAFKAFVAFMQILRGYVGGEYLSVIVLWRLD